jgi:surfeit locus 1 family protein
MTAPRRGSSGRVPWGLSLTAAAAFVLLIGLGVWQSSRLLWKEDLIARAEAAALAEPEPLARVLARPDPEFRRATVECAVSGAPFVELQSIHDGGGGVRLMSLCAPQGLEGTLFLIDRGFIADTVADRPPVLDLPRQTTLTVVPRRNGGPGWMRPPPRDGRFYGRDDAAMAEALGAQGPVSPFTLFAETSSDPDWPALEPAPPPPAFSNNHLGYALTWFGLAIALACFYVLLLRRRLAEAS